MKTIKVFQSGRNFINVQVDTTKLEILATALGKRYKTQVGVMGEKVQRSSDGSRAMTNAEIGAIHEFGSFARNIPERSFLRTPLTLYMGDAVKEGADKINKKLEQADLKGAYDLLGKAAEVIVQRAFQTGGFGNWVPLSPKTIARKKSDAILIDTTQLRKSITSRVVDA